MLHNTLLYPLTPRSLIFINQQRLTTNLSPDSLVHGLEEQGVHFFERDTLGFGNEEERPYAHGDEDGGEKEVGTVAEVADHVGCAAGDDEGSEPGVCGGEGDAEHADVEWEDLGCVCPGDALPCRADDERVHIYTHHGQVTPTVTVDRTSSSSGGRIGFHDISADVPHGNAAKRSTPDETFAATDTFNDDKSESTHAKGLCDAVETSGEELKRSTRDTERFKDARSVVGNDVNLIVISDCL